MLILEARNSSSEVQGELRVIAGDGSSFQNQVNRPHQAADSAILQADRIEQSFLDQYKNDSDLIVGTYNYGLLMGLNLTKQQAEIIRNGAIPILGEPGESPIVNKNPRTGAEYVEIDGGSGGRSIAACYSPYVPRKPGENEVLVKGSMYGSSNGGYVCADPANIREVCSIVSEMNLCINGTFQLDNDWLLSIGVDIAEIRRQLEAVKTPEPTPPQPLPAEPPMPTQP